MTAGLGGISRRDTILSGWVSVHKFIVVVLEYLAKGFDFREVGRIWPVDMFSPGHLGVVPYLGLFIDNTGLSDLEGPQIVNDPKSPIVFLRLKTST